MTEQQNTQQAPAQEAKAPAKTKAPTVAQQLATAEEALARLKDQRTAELKAQAIRDEHTAERIKALEAKPDTIAQALAKVKMEVGHVGKESKAPGNMGGYSFRGVDAVVNACAGPLARHGVVVAPEVLNLERVTNQSRNGAQMLNVYATVRYTFYGPAGDSLATVTVGEAADAGDKAHSKAMSVAYRIALLQTLTLPTDEPDPDSQGYERGAPVQQAPVQQQAPQQQAQHPGVIAVQRRFRSLPKDGYEYLQQIWAQAATESDLPHQGPMATQPHQVEAVMGLLEQAEQAGQPAALDGSQEAQPAQQAPAQQEAQAEVPPQ